MIERVLEGARRAVVAIDSTGEMSEALRGEVIVCGSHGAPNSANHLYGFGPGAAIFHDAGKGKDDHAIACLRIYEGHGLPCATVDCASARIGDARDLWACGIISAVNGRAAALGIEVGMRVEDAARRMLDQIDRS